MTDSRVLERGTYPPRDAAGHQTERRTKENMAGFDRFLIECARQNHPMSIRGLYYQAVTYGWAGKTQADYEILMHRAGDLRKAGKLPYEWIVDGSRVAHQNYNFETVEDAIADCADSYIKNLWHNHDCRVLIWCEKDALCPVLEPVTRGLDVPLLIGRGFNSLSYMQKAAELISSHDVPWHLYYYGDHDADGVMAYQCAERQLREWLPYSSLHFERPAVTLEQIEEFNLPTRPQKESSSNAKAWGGKPCVELDALTGAQLKGLVTECVLRHMPYQTWQSLKAEEEAERTQIRQWGDDHDLRI
jgi:hypothetical protein